MAEERKQTTTQRTKKKSARKKKVTSTAVTVSPGNSAPRRAPKKASPEKQVAPSVPAQEVRVRRRVSPEERYRMIQEAAYYQAEKEGFNCDPWKCWLVAEAEIDAQLNAQA